MKFGSRPVVECEGAVLAHSLKLANKRLKKGHVLTREDLSAVRREGIDTLIVAMPEAGDIGEDDAARILADAMQPTGFTASPAGTGRVNFHASANGVFTANWQLVDHINAIDPAITLATLEHMEPVLDGRMVATVKIIPYAVAGEALEKARKLATGNPFEVRTYRAHRVGVISTRLPALRSSVIAKTLKVLESRLRPSNSVIANQAECEHTAQAVSAALEQMREACHLIVIFGASAISDPDDVIPQGLRLAGGHVERVGMPVDPGNLLMLGALGNVPVIGAPGCSRSPARNGFDFVLERLLAGIPVDGNDIAKMGVGGLLMEIGSRPQPREATRGQSATIAGILLAGGQSRRMGTANKLTLPLAGKPMVRLVAEAGLEQLNELVVITGHESTDVLEALSGLEIRPVHNPDYADGLSSSLKAGIGAVPPDSTHAMILLADMPGIGAAHIEKLVSAVEQAPPGAIIVATHKGKRGNPVVWPRAYFEALKHITGDTGARHLVGENSEKVIEVELGEAASIDLDTPAAYADWLERGSPA